MYRVPPRDRRVGADPLLDVAATPRRACEIRLRAERKAGELDKVRQKNEGGRPSKTGSSVEPVSAPPKLSDLGISKRQAHDWRKLADVPLKWVGSHTSHHEGEIKMQRLEKCERAPYLSMPKVCI